MGREISDYGIRFIMAHEGLRTRAYQDQRGIWTIGYGHTGPDVHPGLVITDEQAGILMHDDLQPAESAVDNAIPQTATQAQFDACVSLAYNIGIHAFQGSTVVREMNVGDDAKAAEAFLLWDQTNGKVNDGLLARRMAEKSMFLGEAQ